jgi:flavorubredoxin
MPTPVQEALGAILQNSDARKKPCGVFGSFGWSGEAVDMMQSALKV